MTYSPDNIHMYWLSMIVPINVLVVARTMDMHKLKCAVQYTY